MSTGKPMGRKAASRKAAGLSPRWTEAVGELEKLRDVLASGEPIERHFRVEVVVRDPECAELLAALRLERARLRLTLSEVSRRSGIDQGDLSRLENGKVLDPRSSTRARYARALGKRLSWSLDEVG